MEADSKRAADPGGWGNRWTTTGEILFLSTVEVSTFKGLIRMTIF